MRIAPQQACFKRAFTGLDRCRVRAPLAPGRSSSSYACRMLSVIDFIQTNRDRYISELKQYLAIPSISALPAHAADVRKCAEWTAEEMRRIQLENVRLIETPGNPVVY